TLTSVGGVAQSGTPVITDLTPDFVITRAGTDTIDKVQVRVLTNAGVQVWSSGLVDVTNGTTATITYSGTTLARGTTYKWTALYQKSTGPTGSEATPLPFRINALPTIPSGLFPFQNHTFKTTDDIIFRANFSDADVSVWG